MAKLFTVMLIGMFIAQAIITYDLGCEREILKAAHDVKAVTAGISQGLSGMATFGFALALFLALFCDD